MGEVPGLKDGQGRYQPGHHHAPGLGDDDQGLGHQDFHEVPEVELVHRPGAFALSGLVLREDLLAQPKPRVVPVDTVKLLEQPPSLQGGQALNQLASLTLI